MNLMNVFKIFICIEFTTTFVHAMAIPEQKTKSISPGLQEMLIKRQKRDIQGNLILPDLTVASGRGNVRSPSYYEFVQGESSTVLTSRKFRHSKRGAVFPRNFRKGAPRKQFTRWQCVRDKRGRCRLTKCAFMAPIDRISHNERFGCQALKSANNRHLKV